MSGSGKGAGYPFRLRLLALAFVVMAGFYGFFLFFDLFDPSSRRTILAGINFLTLVSVMGIAGTLWHRRHASRKRDLSRLFGGLVQHDSEVTFVLASDGLVKYASSSAETMFGQSSVSTGQSFVDVVLAPEDSARASALLSMARRRPQITMTARWNVMRGSEDKRTVEVLVRNLIDDPDVDGIAVILRDITEQAELEAQLSSRAFHDDLTGLANRNLLRSQIEHSLSRWLFQSAPFSLIIVDVDDFKSLNDSLGHSSGDAILKTLATRIAKCCRPRDTVVRLAGDEFAVLLDGVAMDDTEGQSITGRIFDSIRAPIRVEGRTLALRASAGLACVTQRVQHGDDIIRNANLALHVAKSSQRGKCVRFESTMHDAALHRIELEADLRTAIDHDELQVHYQPIIGFKSGAIEGVEALLRWPHPIRGYISPAEFIPVAEESGLIVALGTWVLRQSCAEVRKWQLRYPSQPPLTLNVNLSAHQLRQPDIVQLVSSTLDDTGFPAERLVLEMTESVLMDDEPSIRATMDALVDLGVRLAIDDFGTGYSSLSYLRQFPISVLKIDRSFVSRVGADSTSDDAALVRIIVDLAKTLRMESVAEGIETDEQLDVLRSMGCDVGQGFLLARPAPAEEIRRVLERSSTDETAQEPAGESAVSIPF